MKFTKSKTQILVGPKSMGSIVAQIDEAVLMLDNSLSIVKALQYSKSNSVTLNKESVLFEGIPDLEPISMYSSVVEI